MLLLRDLDVLMMWSNGPVAATRAGRGRERGGQMKHFRIRRFVQGHIGLGLFRPLSSFPSV